jgi:hypothetical protein
VLAAGSLSAANASVETTPTSNANSGTVFILDSLCVT